jgi:hypothetical protein
MVYLSMHCAHLLAGLAIPVALFFRIMLVYLWIQILEVFKMVGGNNEFAEPVRAERL